MNKYMELKNRQRKEIENFPMFFAFSESQFSEGMEKLGLKSGETGEIYSIGGGGYIRKKDWENFEEMFKRHSGELQEEIKKDLNGYGFIYDMFNYELSNHEYCYTYDISDTLEVLNLNMEQIKGDIRLLNGLNKAKKNQLNQE